MLSTETGASQFCKNSEQDVCPLDTLRERTTPIMV